jgi:hypothetical protein
MTFIDLQPEVTAQQQQHQTRDENSYPFVNFELENRIIL